MLSDAKLLELVFDAATCYIPDEELDESQLERIDNIRYHWCKCKTCSGNGIGGHADWRQLEIGFSKRWFEESMELPSSMFLIRFVHLCLHEIIHVIFPELNEEEVWMKASDWIRKSASRLATDLEEISNNRSTIRLAACAQRALHELFRHQKRLVGRLIRSTSPGSSFHSPP
jgi:hypothetical protein